MILFYSVGGGLGHLTRFGTFYATMGFNEPVTVIASSPFARDQRVVAPVHRALIPPFAAAKSRENLIVWLQQIIDEIKPTRFFIDAFPGGILGELNELILPVTCECNLLARIIKWKSYQERIPNFRLHFKKVFVLETLDRDYMTFLREHADTVETAQLLMPPLATPPISISDNTWLVIHSGPDSELQAILQKVEQDLTGQQIKPEVVVIYPGKRPPFVDERFRFENLYPAHALYARAARIYSAAGFNMIQQMRDFRFKHYVMPFSRLFDDQHARVELNRGEYAAIYAE